VTAVSLLVLGSRTITTSKTSTLLRFFHRQAGEIFVDGVLQQTTNNDGEEILIFNTGKFGCVVPPVGRQ